MPDNPTDVAKTILEAATDLNDDQRAAAWDHYYDSTTVSNLARRLMDLDISDETKEQLLHAKKIEMGSRDPVDNAVAAIERLSKIDPTVLHLMEKFPHILKHVTNSIEG